MRSFVVATLVSIAVATYPEQQVLDGIANIQRAIARSNVLPIRTDRFLESSTSPSGSDEPISIKASCVKGQATDIPDLEAQGMKLAIPTTGYCMNDEDTSSMKLTCDGKTCSFFLVFTFLPFVPF